MCTKKKSPVETKVNNKINEKRLVRSNTDKVIAGVCGGLASYFNIDAVIVRLIFAFVTLSGGAGLIIYIVLWIAMPEDGDENKSTKEITSKNSKQVEMKIEEVAKTVEDMAKERNTQLWLGLGVMLLGLFFLLSSLGISRYFNIGFYLSKLWPLFIILLGVLILVKSNNERT